MPKIKTHKSTAKRFRVTGTGKLMRTVVGKSHLRRKKQNSVLGKLDEMHEVTHAGNKRRVAKLAPYLYKK